MSLYGKDYFLNESFYKIEDTTTLTSIKFFGKDLPVRHIEYDNEELKKKYESKIDSVVKIFCTDKALFQYLYDQSKTRFDEVNNDPYFGGKKVNNGTDLINAIKNEKKQKIGIYVGKYADDVENVYICGEYWIDDEHGFSVNFPNGKIRKLTEKGKKEQYYYEKYTTLGGYDAAL